VWLCTGRAPGTRVDKIMVRAVGTTTAGIVRIYQRRSAARRSTPTARSRSFSGPTKRLIWRAFGERRHAVRHAEDIRQHRHGGRLHAAGRPGAAASSRRCTPPRTTPKRSTSSPSARICRPRPMIPLRQASEDTVLRSSRPGAQQDEGSRTVRLARGQLFKIAAQSECRRRHGRLWARDVG